ncbi:hypothetical protein PQ460_10585 [Paenibacillus sp. KACC 21273]|uniref:hypothetical protein n=1 Tax=Paenibacillus sp. KACC 21273 TaxID=3025665 RepID=UPI002365FCF8|nr:hypothetical protein [Paenibacillus sp. KACC 21273]WDF52830.1 hypothetical protein PQ460_10585 [Paenibacillus sp. KACC 21273]
MSKIQSLHSLAQSIENISMDNSSDGKATVSYKTAERRIKDLFKSFSIDINELKEENNYLFCSRRISLYSRYYCSSS